MAGTFTQKRTLDKGEFSVYYSMNGGTRIKVDGVAIPSTQETTSFRSGGAYDSDGFELENAPMYASVRESGILMSHDTGHEFDTLKKTFRVGPITGNIRRRTSTAGELYEGPLVPVTSSDSQPQNGFLPAPKLTTAKVTNLGARAIAQTMPTAPQAASLNAVVELVRDGLPKMLGHASFKNGQPRLRENADEVLNLEFGWKPLAKDLHDILSAVQRSSRILAQYKRDSGRIVRRRFSFPEETVTESYTDPFSYASSPFVGFDSSHFDINSLRGEGLAREIRVTKTRTWFSGAYSYYIDPGDHLLAKLSEYEQLANKLLGTRLTPSVVWEAAPWSWLVDWKSDVGLALSNASAFQDDGLVIRYGYLMRHTVAKRTVTRNATFNFDGWKPGPQTSEWTTVRKERFRATPYGFGLDLSTALSGRQWAILAALGMSKSPRVAF